MNCMVEFTGIYYPKKQITRLLTFQGEEDLMDLSDLILSHALTTDCVDAVVSVKGSPSEHSKLVDYVNTNKELRRLVSAPGINVRFGAKIDKFALRQMYHLTSFGSEFIQTDPHDVGRWYLLPLPIETPQELSYLSDSIAQFNVDISPQVSALNVYRSVLNTFDRRSNRGLDFMMYRDSIYPHVTKPVFFGTPISEPSLSGMKHILGHLHLTDDSQKQYLDEVLGTLSDLAHEEKRSQDAFRSYLLESIEHTTSSLKDSVLEHLPKFETAYKVILDQ